MAPLKWMALLLFAIMPGVLLASDASSAVEWPQDDPVLHFEVVRFHKAGSFENKNVFNIDVMVKNLSQARISNATFHVYFLDKDKKRIAEQAINLMDLDPNGTTKFVMTTESAGTPAEFSVEPEHLPRELAKLTAPKTIATTVETTPSGAKVLLDGKPAGTTPAKLEIAVGAHTVKFEKPGRESTEAQFTVEEDQPEGKIYKFDLGPIVHDLIELRDGSVVSGDLEGISDGEFAIQTADGLRKFQRNMILRVTLVERPDAPPPAN